VYIFSVVKIMELCLRTHWHHDPYTCSFMGFAQAT